MEHRYHPRQPAQFDVTLGNPVHGTVEARVEDLSREGMALRLKGELPLREGCMVNVEIPASQAHLFGSRHLKGYVVHAQANRIGLMLVGIPEYEQPSTPA